MRCASPLANTTTTKQKKKQTEQNQEYEKENAGSEETGYKFFMQNCNKEN